MKAQDQATRQPLSVLTLTSYFIPAFRGGGPIRSLDAMATTHSKDLRMSIVCSNTDLNSPQPLDVPVNQWVERANCRVFYAASTARAIPLSRLFAATRDHYDFLYLNTLFSPSYAVLPALLWRLGAIRADHLLIAPRGQLGPGALSLKHRKKKAFIKAARHSGLFRKAIWHGSSEQEAAEIREAFPRARVVVRENEVSLPARAAANTRRVASKPLSLVYVGRLSEKKGIHTLLESLERVRRSLKLDIYGEFEDERYRQRIEVLAANLSPSISIRFNGAISNSEVRRIFGESDYFVFPTSHENFGHTIVESLSSSCPVVIRDVTPLTEVVKAGGGVIVPDGSVHSWRNAIIQILDMPTESHQTAKVASAKSYENWRDSKSATPSVFRIALEENEIDSGS